MKWYKNNFVWFFSWFIRGEYMKNVIDFFFFLGFWLFVGSFGFNIDIFVINLINLSVVFGVLIFFGKGVCVSCLF